MRVLGVIVVVLALGVAAACGGDDDGDGAGTDSAAASETASGPSVTEMSPDELEIWQTDLNAVGCYAGAVDGSIGPETEAAVKAFQTAKGLSVDGLLGPETEGALEDAVAAGEIVCTVSSGDDGGSGNAASSDSGSGDAGPGSGPDAMLAGELVSRDFIVESCENQGETDIVLVAKGDAFVLNVNAPDGSGTIAYSGGDEQDGIELAGGVASVTVGDDGTFTVEGAWESGEAFTLTGSCAT
jgi:peptidoglycan hydrolase-like protein with peptidoglycan-binding domain